MRSCELCNLKELGRINEFTECINCGRIQCYNCDSKKETIFRNYCTTEDCRYSDIFCNKCINFCYICNQVCCPEHCDIFSDKTGEMICNECILENFDSGMGHTNNKNISYLLTNFIKDKTSLIIDICKIIEIYLGKI